MPRYRDGGRINTSPTTPKLFENRRSASTETKYYGLVRDLALLDLTSKEKALSEVLKDIQDPSEANALGIFSSRDLSIISTIVSDDLKREDFEIILNASVNVEDELGNQSPLVTPRQRISDRITQLESVAGRGTNFVGQGGVLFKYVIDTDSDWSHINPPPFFTEPITSTIENAPDFIPSTPEQIENTHRVGYVLDGEFIPEKETEWWWSAEYFTGWEDNATNYGDITEPASVNPRFPIIKDGNLSFSSDYATGISQTYNWGIRIDGLMYSGSASAELELFTSAGFAKFLASVNGHLRIDYFDKTGYDPNTGQIQGSWKTALNTADKLTYYFQLGKEEPTSSKFKYRNYFIQGGPSTDDGEGTGTHTPRSSLLGGSLNLSDTYLDREGNTINKYIDDYIPIIIRFWYGKPSTNPLVDPLNRSPDSPAAFKVMMLSSNVATDSLSNWNDYSSQLRLSYNGTAWTVDTSAGGSNASEINFSNFNSVFEILAFSNLNSTKPISIGNYNQTNTLTLANKTALLDGSFGATFTVPGITPQTGNTMWVIAKNRPAIVGPHSIANPVSETALLRRSLWQTFLFNPSPTKRYKTAQDLLENVGNNYVEPDPSKRILFDNPKYYQAKHGNFPQLNTYGPQRYDGTIFNSITTSSTQRDYDYNHDKLLFIGRQVKSTQVEPLAPDEIRLSGENYTFLEFKENAAGFGGKVTIYGYPTNNLSVQESASTGVLGKFLNMSDNSDVFSNANRLGSSFFTSSVFPTSFGSTTVNVDNRVLLYVGYDTETVLQVGSWNGSTYSADSSGIISNSNLDFSYLLGYSTLNGTQYYFHSPILLSKKVISSGSFTATTNTISDIVLFGNRNISTDNRQYLGTRIRATLTTDPLVTIDVIVTSYDATSQTVTFSPAITAGTYNITSIDYNEFKISKSLPTVGVNSSSVAVNPLPIISGSPISLESGRILQLRYSLLPSYIYNRVDNGTSLSFGETLFANTQSENPDIPFTPSETQPFFFGAELPAPPSALVTPFGFDNSPTAEDPGLGGICYPPYSSQDPLLSSTIVNDLTLYGSPAGHYDVWWGGKNVNQINLDNKYLTVSDSLSFDFTASDAPNLFEQIPTNLKPLFTGQEYTHKIEIKTKVLLPDVSGSGNINLLNDALLYSNTEPVNDIYYVLVNIDQFNNIRTLSPQDPGWI